MRKFVLAALALMASCAFAGDAYLLSGLPPGQRPRAYNLSVTIPDGGEVFVVGQTQTLVYGGRPLLKNVEVDLSRDGGQTWEVLGTIASKRRGPIGGNKFSWKVAGPSSTNCIVRFSGMIGKKKIAVNSDAFSVAGGGGADGGPDLFTGPAGNAGNDGTVGPAGPAGPQGIPGVAGPKGDAGDIGSMGPQGPAGENGPAGPQGPAGPKGSTGAAGPAGAAGVAGPAGPKGDVGSMGPKGDTGPAGPAGASAGVHIVRGHFAMTSIAPDHYETLNNAAITADSVIILTLVDPDGDNGSMVLTHRVPTAGSVSVHCLDVYGNDIENGAFDYLIVNP